MFCCLEKASRKKDRTSQRGQRKQVTDSVAGMMQGGPLPVALAPALHPAVGLVPGSFMMAAAVGQLALLGRGGCAARMDYFCGVKNI